MGYFGFIGLLVIQLQSEVNLILHIRDQLTLVYRRATYTNTQFTIDDATQKAQSLIPAPAALRTAAIAQPLIFAVALLPLCVLTIAYPFIAQQSAKKIANAQKTVKQAQNQTSNAQRQAEQERQQARNRQILLNPNLLTLGYGVGRKWNPYNATWEKQPPEFPVTLGPVNLSRHLLAVAPTRAGKTANFIRPLIRYCRQLTAAAIFFDPKGYDFDPALFDLNFSMQPVERDTSIRLCIIDPVIAAYDPLGAARKLSEALIPQAQERYFSDAARDAMAALMLAHHLLYSRYPEISQILGYCSHAPRREKLIDGIEELTADSRQPAETRDLAEDALNLLNVTEGRARAKGDPLGALYNALGPLGTGRFKQYVTTDPQRGVTVRQIIQRRLIARIAFTESEGELGKGLGRIIIQQFTDVVLDPTINRSYLKLLVVDEAHRYVCEAMKTITAQAAGSNAGIVLALQGLNQISDPDMRIVIRDNCKNKAVLAGVGNEDAEAFSTFFGEQELEYISTSQSTGQSTGQSYSKGQSNSWASPSGPTSNQGQGVSQGSSNSTGQSVTYKRRPVWLPSEVSQITRYHAIIMLDDGQEDRPTPILTRFLTPDQRAWIESQMPKFELKTASLGAEQFVRTPITFTEATPPAAPTQAQPQPGSDLDPATQAPGQADEPMQTAAEVTPVAATTSNRAAEPHPATAKRADADSLFL